MYSKKRRGFTIRENPCKTAPENCLAEHKQSRAQIGDRRGGLVKNRMIERLGSGGYDRLMKKLEEVAVAKDS